MLKLFIFLVLQNIQCREEKKTLEANELKKNETKKTFCGFLIYSIYSKNPSSFPRFLFEMEKLSNIQKKEKKKSFTCCI